MLKNTLKSTLILGAITLGAFSVSAGAADAHKREGGVRIGKHVHAVEQVKPRKERKARKRNRRGVEIHVGDRSRDRSERRRGWPVYDDFNRGGWERRNSRRHRVCTPRKAVRKARARGLRHAHVIRTGRRGVVVAGRRWGERIVVGFGKRRHCPVRFVRSR